MSFLIIWVHVFMIHMLSWMRYFKSINLITEVTLGYISPKTFPKDCCYLRCLPMTQVLHLSSRWNRFSRLLVHINPILFPWVAGCHVIIWDVFYKTISSLLFSLLVFQQFRSSISCKRALSRSCFPSFRRHCDVALSNPSSRLSKSMFFLFLSI